MIMNKELKLSLFANLHSFSSKPVGLEEVVRLVRHDTLVAQKTAAYRQIAKTISPEEAKKRIKETQVEAFSVGVLFNGAGRQPEHVVRFTGLAMCDFDHVTDLEQIKQKVISDPHTLLFYKTISGDGFRVIYRYIRENAEEPINGVLWRAAFRCGNTYYQQLTGCDFDKQCSDYGRLSGLAHDPDMYYNPDAEPFVITDEMILAANFNADSEQGKPRKEHPAGTQTCSAKEVWPKVEQMLSKRQLTYAPHHHHDYVLHACYLFNRFGVSDDELREWADQQWADYNKQERDALISHCYKKEEEHGTWRLRIDKPKGHENSMITIAEIRQWLGEHVEVIYNMVTDQTMIRKIENGELKIENYHAEENNSQFSTVDERILASLRSQMAVETDKRVLKSDVYDVIKSDFAKLVHPVRDFINALSPWDGTNRVSVLASHIHAEAVVSGQTDAEAQEDLRWALHKWLCGAVATWMSDEVSNHEVFVLIGQQGIYKTTFFRFLLPPELRCYFWENAHNSFSSKDDHLALSENCLAEIEEVDMAGQRDLSELKALVTSVTVKERRPYARFRDEKHRMASFCATGNQQHFLTDDTGNRRWLCFKVKDIDDPRGWIFDYQQLYAQLRDEFRSGFRYWFDYEDQKRVERLNQPFRIESDEEQLIMTRLRPPTSGEPIKLMNAATICQLLNGGHVGYPLSSRKVSAAMRKLGFETIHRMSGNFYRVFEVPYDQVQAHLAMKQYEAEHPSKEVPAEPKLPF